MKRKRSLSRKNPSFPQKILFVSAVFLISFLTYRTYIKAVPTLRIPGPKLKNATQNSPGFPIPKPVVELPPFVVPKSKPPLAMRSKIWTPDKPKLVFVIDDIGNNQKNVDFFRSLNNHVTYAILPRRKYSEYFRRLSHETGAEVILHQPMESSLGKIPGPGLITKEMKSKQVKEILAANLNTVPDYVGANNHMGSKGSSDLALMGTILKELKKRGAFFLDSRTTSRIVSEKLGEGLGIPVLKRDVFLDNVDDREKIRIQIQEMARVARQKGLAIGIGHDRHNTLSVVYEEIPELMSEGFQIVSLSEVVKHSRRNQ